MSFYQIQAIRTRHTREGKTSTQVPTFYLDADTIGADSPVTAAIVAQRVLALGEHETADLTIKVDEDHVWFCFVTNAKVTLSNKPRRFQ